MSSSISVMIEKISLLDSDPAPSDMPRIFGPKLLCSKKRNATYMLIMLALPAMAASELAARESIALMSNWLTNSRKLGGSSMGSHAMIESILGWRRSW